MKERKLNYTFHNPNTPQQTADFILKILMQTNAKKVESAIKKVANDK